MSLLPLGPGLGRDVMIVLFATTGGLTASGIVANLYRLAAGKPEGAAARLLHIVVMVVAGPSVLIQNATTSFRARDCSRLAYGLAVAVCGYWAFAIGLLVINLGLVLTAR